MKRTSRFAVVIGGVAFLGLAVVSTTLDAAPPRLLPKRATTVQPILQEEEVAAGQPIFQEESLPVQSSTKTRGVIPSAPVTYFDPFQLTRKSVAVTAVTSVAVVPVTAAVGPMTAAAAIAPVTAPAASVTAAAPLTVLAMVGRGPREPIRPASRSPYVPK